MIVQKKYFLHNLFPEIASIYPDLPRFTSIYPDLPQFTPIYLNLPQFYPKFTSDFCFFAISLPVFLRLKSNLIKEKNVQFSADCLEVIRKITTFAKK